MRAPTRGPTAPSSRSDTTASLTEEVAALQAECGIHFRPVLGLLHLLQAGPLTMDRLIADSALSHRSVVDILRRLEPWIREGPEGYLLPHAVPGSPSSGGHDEDTLHVMSRLLANVPERRRRFDHLAATPETCARRAGFLDERYWLEGAHVVLLGDHDLTSIALALIGTGARLTVVDIDDTLLEYVARTAGELGFDVGCWFADLRLGLPHALLESADLVFADPPYTPEGMRLFAERGCQALKRDERSRLLLCYGYGERQPALAFKVQTVFHQLKLLLEEVRPGFNRYAGAQAIGSASALYVTRPGAATWQLVHRERTVTLGIYSHGPASIESEEPLLPDELRGHVVEPTPVARLWRLWERHATARPERRPQLPEVASADLTRMPELAPRLLLTSRLHRLQLLLPSRDASELLATTGWQGRFFGSAYDLQQIAVHDSITAIEAERHQRPVAGGLSLVRHLIDHPSAALGSALREALIRSGRAATKNEARERMSRYPALESHRRARAADLPLHVLRQLPELLESLVGEFERPPLTGGSDAASV